MSDIKIEPCSKGWKVVLINGDRRVTLGTFTAKFRATDYAIEQNPDHLWVEQ